VTIEVAAKKTNISVIVEMPNWLKASPGGSPITGSVSAASTNADGISLDGAHISIPSAFIGPVQISNLAVDYQASANLAINGGPPTTYTNLWQGSFSVRFPNLGTIDSQGNPPLTHYGIGFNKTNGFIYGGVKLTPDPAIPIAQGLYLAKIGADYQQTPFTIRGDAIVNSGPSASPEAAVASIHATALVGFGTQQNKIAISQILPGDTRQFAHLTVAMAGEVSLVNRVALGQGHILYVAPDFFEVGGEVNKSFGPLSIHASALGQINFTTWDYFVAAGADICLKGLCGGGNFVLSSVGIGGCFDNGWVNIGGYYKWNGDWDVFWHACDVAGPLFVNVQPRKTGKTASVVSPMSVTSALPTLAFAVKGVGASPHISLVSPSGRTVTLPGTTAVPEPADVKSFEGDGDNTLYVLVKQPEKGDWRVVPQAGTTIAGVQRASFLDAPAITASVSAKGRNRTLTWKGSGLSGQTVTFMAKGETTWEQIGTTHAGVASGRISFAADESDAGPRTIVALIKNGMTVRRSLNIATYQAPGPITPAAPRGVKISRTPNTLTVTWGKQAAGDRAVVELTLADGQVLSAATTGASAAFSVASSVSGTAKVGFLHGDRMFGPMASRSG
jgi:hypothetical protein